MLAPHVDRLPLVSSCIIHVDREDLEEDWPLEVYDRNDRAVNVSMVPGDMVLYESGSLIHGRPFPLKGKSYANIFIHFEPTGERLHYGGDGDDGNSSVWDVKDEKDPCLPPYLLTGSPELENWERRNPTTCWNGQKKKTKISSSSLSPPGVLLDPRPKANIAAGNGDLQLLIDLSKSKSSEDGRNNNNKNNNDEVLHTADENDWRPIHEAVRGGHLEVVKYLVERGNVDINAVTNQGTGSSPLRLAIKTHTKDHPVSKYLSDLGAINFGGDGSDDDEL